MFRHFRILKKSSNDHIIIVYLWQIKSIFGDGFFVRVFGKWGGREFENPSPAE